MQNPDGLQLGICFPQESNSPKRTSDLVQGRPEWIRSHFFNKRLVCLLLIIVIADCFLQSMLQHNLQMCNTTSQEVLKF